MFASKNGSSASFVTQVPEEVRAVLQSVVHLLFSLHCKSLEAALRYLLVR